MLKTDFKKNANQKLKKRFIGSIAKSNILKLDKFSKEQFFKMEDLLHKMKEVKNLMFRTNNRTDFKSISIIDNKGTKFSNHLKKDINMSKKILNEYDNGSFDFNSYFNPLNFSSNNKNGRKSLSYKFYIQISKKQRDNLNNYFKYFQDEFDLSKNLINDEQIEDYKNFLFDVKKQRELIDLKAKLCLKEENKKIGRKKTFEYKKNLTSTDFLRKDKTEKLKEDFKGIKSKFYDVHRPLNSNDKNLHYLLLLKKCSFNDSNLNNFKKNALNISPSQKQGVSCSDEQDDSNSKFLYKVNNSKNKRKINSPIKINIFKKPRKDISDFSLSLDSNTNPINKKIKKYKNNKINNKPYYFNTSTNQSISSKFVNSRPKSGNLFVSNILKTNNLKNGKKEESQSIISIQSTKSNKTLNNEEDQLIYRTKSQNINKKVSKFYTFFKPKKEYNSSYEIPVNQQLLYNYRIILKILNELIYEAKEYNNYFKHNNRGCLTKFFEKKPLLSKTHFLDIDRINNHFHFKTDSNNFSEKSRSINEKKLIRNNAEKVKKYLDKPCGKILERIINELIIKLEKLNNFYIDDSNLEKEIKNIKRNNEFKKIGNHIIYLEKILDKKGIYEIFKSDDDKIIKEFIENCRNERKINLKDLVLQSKIIKEIAYNIVKKNKGKRKIKYNY